MIDDSVLVATRSSHKLEEIRAIVAEVHPLLLIDLDEAGIPERRDEETIEQFDSFEENALAKARYFAHLTGRIALADDSGLCVDALGGAPGVRSKRYSGRPDLSGAELDRFNNLALLAALRGVPLPARNAHYVCVAAIVWPGGTERVVRGTCHGIILEEPRGEGGFGYDPLFYIPEEGTTFGELAARRKNEISHRGRAIRAAAEVLRGLDSPQPH